ncbi:MAG: cytochrome P450 [Actinomycetota bacterium]|jgi:cytochrome P450|nr:cytochrome P450 [Actinomycetota bacterium]
MQPPSTDATADPAGVDLADPAFWGRPLEERHAVFAALRARPGLPFYDEPEPSTNYETIVPRGPGFRAVLRYQDVVTASKDPATYTSGQGAVTVIDLPPEMVEYFGGMISTDRPRHTRLRRIVAAAFTERRIGAIASTIQHVADGVVDTVGELGECDFVVDIAAPLPLAIICDLMGVPASARGDVLRCSNVILSGGDPEFVPEGTDPVLSYAAAGAELTALMEELARFRTERPTDDLTTALVTSNVDGESLTHGELASFFIMLLIAGNETTRNALAHGLWAMTCFPDQRHRWQDDVDGVGPTAVEELLRWSTPVTWMRRTVARNTVLAGEELHPGDKLLLFYGSANRDESVFADPDAFDVLRSPNPHVSFGAGGPHTCLGAHLAHHELDVMVRTLFRRLPDIEASGEPDRLVSSFVNGIKHLPCRFTPEGRRAPGRHRARSLT